ncbi:MAG: alpha/beta hydrolase [Symploca sp. SIO2E6]|nr:alpha/beta hydrolase [Symploca sp. SIO2E6]
MNKQTIRRLLIGKFSLKRLMSSLILIYLIFCLYVFFAADRMLFLPQPASYQDTKEIIKLTSAGQVPISAVYLPNPESTYTILYAHGNAEDLGDIRPRLEELRNLGFSIFAYDYRGYGTSEGTPSERHAYQDIDAAYNYLTEQLGILPQKIMAYGRSVGGGSVVDLAVRQPLAGLILESSFTSVFRVVVPIPLLPFDKFRNLDKIPRVNCPVLVMHGTADEIVPFTHGQQLFATANEPKLSLWVEQAGHNNFRWVADQQYGDKLREFAGLRMGN